MQCPFCNRGDTRVLESRISEDAMRRRRECEKCGKRFTTYERIETTNLLVVKKSGDREQFNREKLLRGVLRACEKRPVSSEQIERVLDDVEAHLKKAKRGEVSTKQIGELVMRNLKRLDKVAYIRFASVYLDFKDPDDFARALDDLSKKR